MSDLLPCPFCGGKPESDLPPLRQLVSCKSCGASVVGKAAWSARSDVALAMVAAVQKQSQKCMHPWCGDKCGEPLPETSETTGHHVAIQLAEERSRAALDALLKAERAKALREAADWCAAHTMDVSMNSQNRKYAAMYAAGENTGGVHAGMGYADAIRALIDK